MEQESWTTDEIEAVVSGFFTTRHSLQTATGIMGELTLLPLRSNDVFRFASGRELMLKRKSWWQSWYELEENGIVSGSTHSHRFFQRETVIQFGGKEFVLKPAKFWTRYCCLINDTGTPLLEIRPQGIFRRGAWLTILGPVDAALLVFTYYLVRIRWSEQTAAAAG